MHLVSALAAGVNGCEGGTARIYSRGTTTKVSWFANFEDSSATSSADIALDENGGATVYVNQYVTVQCLDSDGNPVRTFTDGAAAANVEVRSQSFTNTGYAGEASAAGNPIDLNTVLGLWLTSSGSTNFNVLLDGSSTSIQNALGAIGGLFFNVKSPEYGALGDGTTDDTTAITAAIAAADAAGGIVFFPGGDYIVTSTITIAGTSIVGSGAKGTALRIDAAAAPALTLGASTRQAAVVGMTIDSANANTSPLVSTTGTNAINYIFSGVRFDSANHTDPAIKGSTAAVMRFTFSDCVFTPGANENCVEVGSATGGRWAFRNSRFITPTAHTPANGIVYGDRIDMVNCEFDTSSSTSGTISCYTAGSTTLDANITGCTIPTSGGATVTGFTLGTYVSGSKFYEGSNNIPTQGDATFTAYSYTNSLSGTDTATAVFLGTRDFRYYRASVTYSGANDIQAIVKQYGNVSFQKTDTASFTFNISARPPNTSKTYIFIENSAGADITGVDFTSVYGGHGSHTINDGKITTYVLQPIGTSRTIMISYDENTTQ